MRSPRSLPATRPSGRHYQALLPPAPPIRVALREARTGASPCIEVRQDIGTLVLREWCRTRSGVVHLQNAHRVFLGARYVPSLGSSGSPHRSTGLRCNHAPACSQGSYVVSWPLWHNLDPSIGIPLYTFRYISAYFRATFLAEAPGTLGVHRQ